MGKDSCACPVGRGRGCCKLQGQCGGFTGGIMQGRQPVGKKWIVERQQEDCHEERNWARKNIILRGFVGSFLFGTLDKI